MLAFLSILNILDASRAALVLMILLAFHCTCKRKALRYRFEMEANAEGEYPTTYSEGLLSDCEKMYRHHAMRSF